MKINFFDHIKNQLEKNSPVRLTLLLGSEHIFFDWRMDLHCNLNCEYCFFDSITRSMSSLNETVVEKTINLINNSKKKFIINICGGEPFYIKNIIQIIKDLTKKSDLIIGTNLICNNINEFANSINIERIPFMLASYHYKYLNNQQRIRFFKHFLYLQNKGFNIVFGIIYHPSDDIENVKYIIQDAKQKGVKFITLKTFIGEYKNKTFPDNYSRKHISFIKKYALLEQEINIAKNKFHLYKKNCIAGLNYFHITPKGDILDCDVNRKKITNILNLTNFEDLTSKGQLTFCKQKMCYCLGPLLNIQ